MIFFIRFLAFTLFFLVLSSFQPSYVIAQNCNPTQSQSSPTYKVVSMSSCFYDSEAPENPSPEFFGYDLSSGDGDGSNYSYAYNITSVRGYIKQISALNGQYQSDGITPTTYELRIRSSSIDIGKLFVAYNGTVNISDASSVNFIGEGLQVQKLDAKDSSRLSISGATSNSSIDNISLDDTSSLFVENEAYLLLKFGNLKKDIYIDSGATVEFMKETDDEDNNPDTADVYFSVSRLNLNDANIKKSGLGTVDVSFFNLTGDSSITVTGGILKLNDIGILRDLPMDKINIYGGTLKVASGQFKAFVSDAMIDGLEIAGEIIYEGDEDLTLEVNGAPDKLTNSESLTGTVTANGSKYLRLSNTSIENLKIISGNVLADAVRTNINIKNLDIQGGVFESTSRSGQLNNLYLENLSISSGGQYIYRVEDLSTLQSLDIINQGEFKFLGTVDLVLDGIDSFCASDEECSSHGVIVVGNATKSLTIKNSDIGILKVDSLNTNSSNTLDINENNHIFRLELSLNNSGKFDIAGSNIEQVFMKRSGIINIMQGAELKTLGTEGSFFGTINIHGGNINTIALSGKQGDVNIDGNPNIGTLSLYGDETVNLTSGSLETLDIMTASKAAELNIIGGEIVNLNLNNVININLQNTHITNYNINIVNQTFDLTYQNIDNIKLNGKGSTVNLGNEFVMPSIKTIVLDYGNLVYRYAKDYYIESIQTTLDHIPAPVESCDPETDTECEEGAEEEITYDSSFVLDSKAATLTVDNFKVENLVIETGYLKVNDTFETQRKLTINIDDDNLISSSVFKPRIYSKGNITIGNLFQAKFTETYNFALSKTSAVALVASDGEIITDSDFHFLTNLSSWFEVKERICTSCFGVNQAYIVDVVRVKTYEDVLSVLQITEEEISLARFLGLMINDGNIPAHLRPIITGLDTDTDNPDGLLINIRKLQPINNKVVAHAMHSNNYKLIDNLSLELRDLDNESNNLWFKTAYSTSNLSNRHDIVGYREESTINQVGYNHLLTDKLSFSSSVGYVGGKLKGKDASYFQDFTSVSYSIGFDYLISDHYYTKLVALYSKSDFSNSRNLSFASSVTSSSNQGSEALVHLESGYVTLLPNRFRSLENLGATYKVYYSLSNLGISSYQETGNGRLDVEGTNSLVNDFGIGIDIDKEISYEEGISLKPYGMFMLGFRSFSNVDTGYKFQETDYLLNVSDGDFFPIFAKTKFGMHYIKSSLNISLGYQLETGYGGYADSMINASFKYSFK